MEEMKKLEVENLVGLYVTSSEKKAIDDHKIYFTFFVNWTSA